MREPGDEAHERQSLELRLVKDEGEDPEETRDCQDHGRGVERRAVLEGDGVLLRKEERKNSAQQLMGWLHFFCFFQRTSLNPFAAVD